MALVEKRGLVNLDSDSDSDSEDLPLPLASAKSNTKIQYVVLSDSSDDEDDGEGEEQGATQRAHTAWMRRLQSTSSLSRNLSSAQNRSFQNTASRELNQQLRTTSTHSDAISDQTRVEWPMQNELDPTSSQAKIGNPLFTRDKRTTSHAERSTQTAETNHPTFTAGLHPIDINDDEYVLSLFNEYYPEYSGTTEPGLQKYPETDEMSVRANESHTDMVPLHNFDEALGIVLEVLPDICTEFVRQKYDERKEKSTYVDADSLLADILSEKSYPKQKLSKKRKRQDGEVEEEDIEILDSVVPPSQIPAASRVLQKQFNSMPASYIASVVKLKKSVYDAICTLTAVEKSPSASQSQPYQPLRKKRRGGIVELNDISDPTLKAQFQAAYRKISKDEEAEVLQQMRAEEDTKATERAFELRDVSECQCCFDTYPNAKMVVCNGKMSHAFCTDCLTGHIKAQLDLQKHDIKCMDGSNCTAGFSRSSKQKALDTATFERWERLEQQNVLRESGLPLDHCPFCDFAAICPPVEEDRELRCQGPECGIVSCRLCKQKSHVPLTCREYKREQGFDERHKIEEEMTKALLRMCPKCKIPIFKDGGCNKITCSRCHSYICDVCGKDISMEGYKHFIRGGCPQADEIAGARRAADRVKVAEEAARDEVLAANPDLSAADLEIKGFDNAGRKERVSAAAAIIRERNRERQREIALRVRHQRAMTATFPPAAAATAMQPGPFNEFHRGTRNLMTPPLVPSGPTTPQTANPFVPPAVPANQFVYPGTIPAMPQHPFYRYSALPPVTPLLQHGLHHITHMTQPLYQPTYTYAPHPYLQTLPATTPLGGLQQTQLPELAQPQFSDMFVPYVPGLQYNQAANQTTTQRTPAGQAQTSRW